MYIFKKERNNKNNIVLFYVTIDVTGHVEM